MAGSKHKNISNRNQVNMALSVPNYLAIASPRYTITLENQKFDLKSLVMMMIEDISKDINSLKEIPELCFCLGITDTLSYSSALSSSRAGGQPAMCPVASREET